MIYGDNLRVYRELVRYGEASICQGR